MTNLTRLTSDISQDVTDLYVAFHQSTSERFSLGCCLKGRPSDVGAGVGSFRLCSHTADNSRLVFKSHF